MAILYITEYAAPRQGNGFQVGSLPEAPPLATQAVTFTTSTQSANLNAKTRYVRIHTDGICSIRWGGNPTAVITDPRMVAGQTEFFTVSKEAVDAGLKIAAVTNT